MLEQIIYDVTRTLLAGDEVDADALYFHLGSNEMTDEIINGIKRAIEDHGNPFLQYDGS